MFLFRDLQPKQKDHISCFYHWTLVLINKPDCATLRWSKSILVVLVLMFFILPYHEFLFWSWNTASGFLLQFKDMRCRWIGISKLSIICECVLCPAIGLATRPGWLVAPASPRPGVENEWIIIPLGQVLLSFLVTVYSFRTGLVNRWQSA